MHTRKLYCRPCRTFSLQCKSSSLVVMSPELKTINFSVVVETYLLRQFTCRRKYEDYRSFAGLQFSLEAVQKLIKPNKSWVWRVGTCLIHDVNKSRPKERGGFTTTRLGNADYIASRQSSWYALESVSLEKPLLGQKCCIKSVPVLGWASVA